MPSSARSSGRCRDRVLFFFLALPAYGVLYFPGPEGWHPHLLPILIIGLLLVWRLITQLTRFGGWAMSTGGGGSGSGFSGGGSSGSW